MRSHIFNIDRHFLLKDIDPELPNGTSCSLVDIDTILPTFRSCFLVDIVSKIFQNLLDGSSSFFGACLFQNLQINGNTEFGDMQTHIF